MRLPERPPPCVPASIPYPDINPVAVQLGPFAVKWYGLAYMVGLLLGWLYIKHLLRQDRLWPGGRAPFSPDKTDDLLLYMTLGVLLGGRLGYVLFYEPRYFLSHPADIIAIWNGGMAFHGALIGSIVAVFPGAGSEPRHPSQIYEGLLEGVVIFAVLAWLTHRREALRRPGLIVGTFLALYAASASSARCSASPT